MAGYRSIWGNGRKVAEYKDDQLVWYDSEYWSRNRSDLSAPTIIRDIGEYRSPIDSQMITSRSAHREHMRAHDVIEVGNERVASVADTVSTKQIGEAVKRHIEEVKSLPQKQYDTHVQTQQAEHAAIASLVTAS